jgi:hypothetical protein
MEEERRGKMRGGEGRGILNQTANPEEEQTNVVPEEN